MKAGPYFVSRIMPSAAVQSVMDTSLFWQRKIGGAMRVDYPSAFANLNRDKSLKNGQIFMNAKPAFWGLRTLAAWSVGAYWAAWFAPRGKKGIKDVWNDFDPLRLRPCQISERSEIFLSVGAPQISSSVFFGFGKHLENLGRR